MATIPTATPFMLKQAARPGLVKRRHSLHQPAKSLHGPLASVRAKRAFGQHDTETLRVVRGIKSVVVSTNFSWKTRVRRVRGSKRVRTLSNMEPVWKMFLNYAQYPQVDAKSVAPACRTSSVVHLAATGEMSSSWRVGAVRRSGRKARLRKDRAARWASCFTRAPVGESRSMANATTRMTVLAGRVSRGVVLDTSWVSHVRKTCINPTTIATVLPVTSVCRVEMGDVS